MLYLQHEPIKLTMVRYSIRVLGMMSLLLLVVSTLLSNETIKDFSRVKVEPGDGINSIMNKYGLSGYACNLEKFCELNNVKKGDHLLLHKEYILPIKLYTYNGKNIRSSIGISDYEKALRIQKYNDLLHGKGVKKDDFRKSGVLWVPYHEIEDCESISNPSGSLTDMEARTENAIAKSNTTTVNGGNARHSIIEPLFGKKYERVEIEDYSLKDQVFYIISGHGGPDPGAVYKGTPVMMCEDEYAYDVCIRLARNLMQHGAKVYLIVQDPNDGIRDETFLMCDKDEKVYGGKSIPYGQVDRLKQRTDLVNSLYRKHNKLGAKSQKAIEIHVDSRSQEKRQDVFFYYNSNRKGSKELATNVKSTFQQKYDKHQKGRGYKGYIEERGVFTLRKLEVPCVFVELANIRNTNDHKRLLLSSNRQAVANWLFEGMKK